MIYICTHRPPVCNLCLFIPIQMQVRTLSHVAPAPPGPELVEAKLGCTMGALAPDPSVELLSGLPRVNRALYVP